MKALPRFALMSMTALATGLGQLGIANAHGVESTLRYLDGHLELSSSFSTGEPVEGAMVRLLEADGSPGATLGRIDATGRLQVKLPDLVDGVVDLQIDGGPGHRDYLSLPLEQGRVNLDEVVTTPHPFNVLPWTMAPALVGMIGLMVRVRSSKQQR